MWIFTDFGFFSVVAHRDQPDRLLVRARVRADLEALVGRLPRRLRIQSTPSADYPFRVIVKREVFAKSLAGMAERIQYDNFKDAVGSRQGRDRAHAYLGVWGHLRKWFAPPAPKRRAG